MDLAGGNIRRVSLNTLSRSLELIELEREKAGSDIRHGLSKQWHFLIGLIHVVSRSIPRYCIQSGLQAICHRQELTWCAGRGSLAGLDTRQAVQTWNRECEQSSETEDNYKICDKMITFEAYFMSSDKKYEYISRQVSVCERRIVCTGVEKTAE